MRLRTLYILSGCLLILTSACRKEDKGRHSDGMPMTISSFIPARGGAGTSVLITGSNFTTDTAAIDVTINGKQLIITAASSTQIMAVVPKRCGTGKLVVKIGNDTIASTDLYNYIYTRVVSTFAGNGTAGFANGPGKDAMFNFNGTEWYRSMGLAVDNDGNVFVADPGNHCIRKITADGMVSTLAGNQLAEGHADGKGSAARFKLPYGVTTDPQGNVYSVDPINYDIRKITPDGNATTIGWGTQSPWSIAFNVSDGQLYYTGSNSPGNIYALAADGSSKAVVSNLNSPAGIGFDRQGNLYAVISSDHTVMRFAAGTWEASVIAGMKGVPGFVNGPGADARFNLPWGMATDADGNILVAGNGTWNGATGHPDQSIRIISANSWNVAVYAGGGTAGYTDGIGEAAAFSAPGGVAVSKNGVVYVLDKNNNRIRRIISE
ncbi:hypothetical protein ECE50_029255 [Chitinophaga sp. Mgbs1]|uniref:IPT/TIG domain-containing protein n=1 Tax=Chitinophaga solisilvae TaxID=1233460 RepID=A0A433WDA0_9BACT|nr:hypothetical protein [Chitinophaga solisilvae]